MMTYSMLLALSRPGCILRRRLSTSIRSAFEYKPKEQKILADATSVLAHRDITLFRYEASSLVFKKNLLAMAMLPVWSYLAYFAYSLGKRLKPYQSEVGQRGWVLENVLMLNRGVAVGFFLFGSGLTCYWMARTMNTVRQLVLRKGGKFITIVTYGPFGKRSKHSTVPVAHCSAVHQRFQNRQRLFLRVRDHSLKYQLNVEDGKILNRPLFDKTVGLARRL